MKLGCKVGQMVNFGHGACSDCAYYRRVAGYPTVVLVVTADEEFAEILRRGENAKLELFFARSAYEASNSVGRLHPGFVVLDQSLLTTSGSDLVDSLANDPRAPGMKIILATGPRRGVRVAPSVDKLVVASLEKPFGVGRILQIVDSFRVERRTESD